ncbi:MAG: hypothetical protein JF609_11875, partial [Verrucomicrobia bacterium]|nr:hypothetical protein [Verrucomicrobiota bacterium]
MNSGRNIEHPPGLSLVDIYFVVFRQKWLILAWAVLVVAAATAYYFMRQPMYQSSAKLMIKYITESRPVNPADNGSQTTSTSDPNASMMNSELEILKSFDIYQEVATNIGPEKVLGKGATAADVTSAASVIRAGVDVQPSRDSTVISITFSHPDPSIVRPVLGAIIDAYHEKHTQVHKA